MSDTNDMAGQAAASAARAAEAAANAAEAVKAAVKRMTAAIQGPVQLPSEEFSPKAQAAIDALQSIALKMNPYLVAKEATIVIINNTNAEKTADAKQQNEILQEYTTKFVELVKRETSYSDLPHDEGLVS